MATGKVIQIVQFLVPYMLFNLVSLVMDQWSKTETNTSVKKKKIMYKYREINMKKKVEE